MADDIEIKIDDRIAASIASKLREIKGEATEADTAIERLKARLNVGNSASLLVAANNAAKLNAALKAASTTTYSMVGRTSSLVERARVLAAEEAKAAAAVDKANAALKRQQSAAAGSTGALRNMATALGAFVGIRAFVDAANDAQTISNKLRVVSADAEQFARVQDKIYAIAIENRVAVADLATSYQRFAFALKGVASENDVLNFVDTLSKSLVVFGATSAEASSVMTQLSQAFNKGKLDGDEFRTVMEALPALSDSLTSALGKSKDQLYALSKAGLITPKVILEAFKGSAEGIKAAFDSTIPTIEQALTVFQDQLTQFMSKNSAASTLLANAIMLIGDNLNLIVPLVIAFGAAWAFVQLVNIIADIYKLAEGMVEFTAKNAAAIIQLGLWVAAIVLAINAIVVFSRIIAQLIGQGEQFDEFLANTAVQAINFGKSLLDGMGTSAADAANQFGASMTKAGAALNPGVTKPAADAKKAIADIGTASKTAADTAVTNIKRIDSSLMSLTSRLNYTAAAAKKLFDQLAAGNYNPGNYNPSLINTGANSSIQTLKTGDMRNGPSSQGYATGGQFTVGGRGGRDTNPVNFMATKGEQVTIRTKSQQREDAANSNRRSGDMIINFTVVANDADSFRRSRSQVAADFARIVK